VPIDGGVARSISTDDGGVLVSQYDVVTVGGGLGGAALAKVLAAAGRKVLVLERTNEFKDRVRGEVLVPWGRVEAQKLGLEDLLASAANEMRYWEFYFDGALALRRDLVTQGPLQRSMLCFYHPRAQDMVLEAARNAGAEIRRGVTVRGVEGGKKPAVLVDGSGGAERIEAKLVVGVDGRESAVRKWCGFEEKRAKPRRYFGGVLFEELPGAPVDVLASRFSPSRGLISWIFPQGGGRVRAYIGSHLEGGIGRLQGSRDIERFADISAELGVPREWFQNAKVAGPLATFDPTDSWIDHPYKDGVALIGDAAATSDPTWGQGMSLTFFDVRSLAEKLLAGDDWDAAGHAYAAEHDWCWEAIRLTDTWLTDMLLEIGDEADRVRARALPLILQDPTRVPEAAVSGPQFRADEDARRRFFAEA
jgi:2-polyprenyl-6-methoxyphenol hydroxylase-like FAD-dependent oxidoreductase